LSDLSARVAAVRDRIRRAAETAGRDPDTIRLIAVSKGHSADAIREALDLGLTEFGENYLQELEAKTRALGSSSRGDAGAPRWHFQGTLQRRKIRDILRLTDSILSVARVEEIDEIAKRATDPVSIHLEINVGGETSKSGAPEFLLPELLAAAGRCGKIEVEGLMTIPPDDDDPARWFRRLRELALANDLKSLSMGMSHDLEGAVREGATMVRIGTAIFGERPAPKAC
jgi:pyridoxal phosphate enzyme (YggS family)